MAKIIKRLLKTPEKNASTPDGERLYAIGDIHGEATLLDQILEKVEKDARDAKKATVVFLGDYVDRGPDSRGVIDRLIDYQKGNPTARFLKGNHEAVMLDFLHEPEDMLEWLEWGGDETLRSYGVSGALSKSGEDLARELAKAMPAAHRTFLESLEITHRAGDYFFVHAGVRPGVALDDQDEEDLLWIRRRFHDAYEDERPDAVIVHGHHPTKKPMDAGWRIGVDTGACWSGKLTAVCLDGKKRRFLST